jgi:hypothetical protein
MGRYCVAMRQPKILVILAAAVLPAVMALPATSALAATSHLTRDVPHAQLHVLNASGCVENDLGLIDEVCIDVTGSDLHIDSIVGSVTNQTPGPALPFHLEISGPNGHLRKNCSIVNIGFDQSTRCKWAPNKKESAGQYCVTAWWGRSGYQDVGKPCEDVCVICLTPIAGKTRTTVSASAVDSRQAKLDARPRESRI